MLSMDDVARALKAMQMAYGAKFDKQWEGVGVSELLAFWHGRLADVPKDALDRALDVLLSEHPFPPTLPEFHSLCRQFIRPKSVAAIDWHAPRNRKAAVVHLKSLREILEGRL